VWRRIDVVHAVVSQIEIEQIRPARWLLRKQAPLRDRMGFELSFEERRLHVLARERYPVILELSADEPAMGIEDVKLLAGSRR
jgi:hypothetical protein